MNAILNHQHKDSKKICIEMFGFIILYYVHVFDNLPAKTRLLAIIVNRRDKMLVLLNRDKAFPRIDRLLLQLVCIKVRYEPEKNTL